MNSMLRRSMLAAGAVLLLTAAPALADTVKFKADLKGASEVPPAADAKGTGTVEASYDTASKALTWTVTYSGLTGDPSAAHFHGPAAEGANAPPVVPVPAPLASPIKGNATLTDAQAADLQGGKWYFNIHTARFPNGEIRGQVTKQ